MSLIVEDGTVVDGADSYVTVAYADTYHQQRGNTSWFSSAGVISDNVTVSIAAAVGSSTLTLATDATGAFLFRAGDQLTIGAFTYTVTAATSAIGASTTGTVAITPPVQLALAGGEAVTIFETVKEVSLRYATRFLDDRYEWLGIQTTSSTDIDRLNWPRGNVFTMEGHFVDSESVPYQVEQATAEIALENLSLALNEVRERGGFVLAHGVGPLFQQFSKGAPGGRTYPYVDSLVRDLVSSSAMQPWLSRG